ncbi:MAG: hypothetical protein AAFP22_18955, partial [Planctomycetota bacterium]
RNELRHLAALAVNGQADDEARELVGPDERLVWPLDLAELEALAARAWSPEGPEGTRPELRDGDGGDGDGRTQDRRAGRPQRVAAREDADGGGLDDLRRIEQILRGIEDGRLARGSARELGRSLRGSVGPFRSGRGNGPPASSLGAAGTARGPGERTSGPPEGEPRTAFLRTRIQPARRTTPAPPAAGTAPPTEGATVEERLLQAALEPGAPLLTREELDAFFGPGPEDTGGVTETPTELGAAPWSDTATLDDPAAPLPTESPAPTARTAGEQRPAWLKDQVADLADIVQALDLSARASHAHTQIGDELARLRQFTRTLGIVAAPPPRGDRTFDLSQFVEEQLGAAAGRSVDAPRLLFRREGAPEADVRADKMLLALALDALLQTAIACSTSGDVVRVELTADASHAASSFEPKPDGSESAGAEPAAADSAGEGSGDDAESGELVLRIDFPSGPLAGRRPDVLLRPYALRGDLPTIGPNALPAAGAIAVGQGGDLLVEELSGGRSAFVVTLPARVRRSVH